MQDAIVRAEDAEVEAERVSNQLRMQSRELQTLRTELLSMHNLTTDSTKLLTEKLALAREMAALKPELEHLRSQATSQQGHLSEKLALQRQLTTVQVELENEKRTSQRALAKRRDSEYNARQESQIEDLRKELATEKLERKKVNQLLLEAKAELKDDQITSHRNQTSAEKALRELEVELAKEKERTKRALEKQGKKADQTAETEERIDELQTELSKEKRTREKAEKTVQKSSSDWEAQKSLLDDKLDQFRNKLKAAKEELKSTREELQKAQTAASARPATKVPTEKPVKNARKRGAAQMDADATTLGTPGDGLPAKREKRANSTLVGEKSTFSITPFLNRTSLAPESPEPAAPHVGIAAEGAAAAEVEDEIEEVDQSPSAVRKVPTKNPAAPKTKPKPLATASGNKSNVKKAPPRKRAVMSTLEKVTEEGDDDESNDNENAMETANPAALKSTTTATTAKPTQFKPKAPLTKPSGIRKSLASFATFTAEPEPERKKKRKLLGGPSALGKTLFDEEDSQPIKPAPGMFGGARGLGFGAFGGRGGKGLLGKGGVKAGGMGMVIEADGFQFSPLKRDRRALGK
ncbi:hypothetical protein B0A49_05435 [Cryomyces minteri]|uniref:Uncharacterized protein n=1 Tax=Cryomyces minteri TaxID=331657 RepID=A0A4U0X8B2_9PEZI|nr:hypothetical protein B0A49_05435 [Cryomyces minteri]